MQVRAALAEQSRQPAAGQLVDQHRADRPRSRPSSSTSMPAARSGSRSPAGLPSVVTTITGPPGARHRRGDDRVESRPVRVITTRVGMRGQALGLPNRPAATAPSRPPDSPRSAPFRRPRRRHRPAPGVRRRHDDHCSVDAARSAVRTLDRAVQRGDEVGPQPGAGLRGRVPVELDQLGVADRPALGATAVEDHLHRDILARWCMRPRSTRGDAAQSRAWARSQDQQDRDSLDRSSPLYRPARGCQPGPVDLAELDPAETPGFSGSKADAPAATEALAPELGDLQERLYAAGRMADAPAQEILMVLQGMDTSGKGGVIRHAIGMVDPQGVQIKAFKAPTEEERAHHYLWRIETRGAAAGHDRHLRPVAVRGRADRPGEQAGRGGGLERALRRDQCLRGATRRRRHDSDQVLPAHLRRRAEGPAAGPAGRPDQALEVQPR